MLRFAIVLSAFVILFLANNVWTLVGENHPEYTGNISKMYWDTERKFKAVNETKNFFITKHGNENLKSINGMLINIEKIRNETEKIWKYEYNSTKDFCLKYFHAVDRLAVELKMKQCIEQQKRELNKIFETLYSELVNILFVDGLKGSQNCENMISYKNVEVTIKTRRSCYFKLMLRIKSLLRRFKTVLFRIKKTLKVGNFAAINMTDCTHLTLLKHFDGHYLTIMNNAKQCLPNLKLIRDLVPVI